MIIFSGPFSLKQKSGHAAGRYMVTSDRSFHRRRTTTTTTTTTAAATTATTAHTGTALAQAFLRALSPKIYIIG
jgi:hypothetical protein